MGRLLLQLLSSSLVFLPPIGVLFALRVDLFFHEIHEAAHASAFQNLEIPHLVLPLQHIQNPSPDGIFIVKLLHVDDFLLGSQIIPEFQHHL